ncbi:nucleoside diphosphate kinase regulator [Methylonatrum kenyense]|uniref:nucleoside diphosphate kinase regulator n=1 Tax=Methylonatrum kenyense TaxID=455253 RepID=UPI0020BE4071|nr:nucleoside diphosphate kinase regulator [Methylonatrum kenyense]MCK8517222.1 nucleoside diphosphate kinase regulator [Methylonatrum kenyense]
MTEQPPIVISEQDLERLERLVESLSSKPVPGLEELENEISRADVVPSSEIPPNVVTMNSTVRFREVDSNREFQLTLVYPRDQGVDGSTISVLAPVGSALLGLSEGATIEWPKPGGGFLHVTIEEVIYQPERAGNLHR